MPTATNIEWVPYVWNPITGCPGPKVSEGCTHCYAERMAVTRLRGRMGYDSTDPFKITYHYGRYDQFLKKRKHTRVFVNSMGDLFHPDVDQHELDCVFAAMLCSEITTGPSHEFLILTKRPDIMAEYFAPGPDTLLRRWGKAGDGWLHVGEGDEYFSEYAEGQTIPQEMTSPRSNLRQDYLWPLPNLWLGVTVCNQAEADAKIPLLLQTPAAKRFVSVEPMLGAVDLTSIVYPSGRIEGAEESGMLDALRGLTMDDAPTHQALDWVICGGETGSHARPVNYAWVYKLAEQCWSAGTPFFFKGWGEWTPAFFQPDGGYRVHRDANIPDGFTAEPHVFAENPGIRMYRVGKRHSGRLLNEREWNEIPEVSK